MRRTIGMVFLCLLACATLLLVDAHATPTPSDEETFFSFSDQSTYPAQTFYLSPYGPMSAGTVEGDAAQIMTASGTVQRLALSPSAGPGVGKTMRFTVYKNGSATTMLCDTSGSFDRFCECPGPASACGDDTSDYVSFVAGDTLSIQGDCTAGTCTAFRVRGTLTLAMDEMGTQVLSGGNLDGDLGLDSDGWYSLAGQTVKTASSNVEAKNQLIVPWTSQLQDLRVELQKAPGSGDTVTLALYKNGSSTDLTCVISGASETTCEDTTNSVSLEAHDLIAIKAEGTGTPDTAANHLAFSVKYTHQKRGHFILPATNRGQLDVSSSRYYELHNGDVTAASTFAANTKTGLATYTSRPHFYVSGLVIGLTTAPGSGKSYSFDVREKHGFGADASVGLSAILSSSEVYEDDFDTLFDSQAYSNNNVGVLVTPTFSPAATYWRVTIVGTAIDPITRRISSD